MRPFTIEITYLISFIFIWHIYSRIKLNNNEKFRKKLETGGTQIHGQIMLLYNNN
jgi:hypothetical protein